MSQISAMLKDQYLPSKNKVVNRPNTPEFQAVNKLESEIESMEKECAHYNNPEHFAKFGKMQRQILKLQKELKILIEKAQNGSSQIESA